MVYSGEAYNFKELRDELDAKREKFATSSDTEVVLRGYLQWGEAVAERLNGMYAFAIWDSRDRKLVMIRDRMGIKPFYFYPTSDGVLFGSEPKAILANPLAKRVVDVDGLREMLVPVKTPKQAVWKGMAGGRAGHRSSPSTSTASARAPTGGSSRSCTPTTATPRSPRVRELLDDIVRRQLVADVPECVLLSGGLDSSAITALSARELTDPVRTFAVDFVDQAENFTPNAMRQTMDTPYVHDVAKHVGSDHTDIVLDHNQLADLDLRRKVVGRARHADGPRRHGRVALPVVQGDPAAVDGGAVRRVGGRDLRRLPPIPRSRGAADRCVPVDRDRRRPHRHQRPDPHAGIAFRSRPGHLHA